MKARHIFTRPVAAAFLIALAGALPARAADIIGEEPPAPQPLPIEEAPVNTWSGPYAGVTLGYGFAGRTNTPGNEINTDGFNAGGFGGFNMQNGMFVYGLEGDLGYNGNRGTNAGTSSRTGIDGSVRARAGVALNERMMVYGTAGGAAARMKIQDAAGADNNTMLGYTVGAGTDVKLTERVFARGEYRFTDYGAEVFNTGSGAQSVDAHENTVKFGLGVKF